MVSAEKAADVEDSPAPDPLAALILDLNERVERLEFERKVAGQLIHTLADACGYELEITEDGLKWQRRSGLVTL